MMPKETDKLSPSELLKELDSKFANVRQSSDLPEGEPERLHADFLSDGFTQTVGFLRDVFPNRAINKLAAILWDVVGHKIVPVAFAPGIKTVSFFATKRGPLVNAYLVLPPAWGEMYHEEPVLQTGAIVFNGSQAVDVYNDRLDNLLPQRATMYEAEYLRTIVEIAPLYKMNDYQKSVVAQFPQGVESPGAKGLLYESKPFFIGRT